MRGLFHRAEQMAKAGLGTEDIFARLSNEGLTRYEADYAVFGKQVAMRREARRRGRQEEKEAS